MHNEKSLKPLGQIELPDHNDRIAVYIRNNGLGPLIIDRLCFSKDGKGCQSIKDCLELDPKSYMRVPGSVPMPRVVLPNDHLTVFETVFDQQDEAAYKDRVRLELSAITLKVTCRDIYDNEIILKRDFQWFARYLAAT